MIKRILTIVLLLLIGTNFAEAGIANDTEGFEYHMNIWNVNSTEASKLLKLAEKEFKKGDELQGCVKQRKAAELGIKGTQSLIKAFEINNSSDDLSNIRVGLNKWKELRDFC